MAEKRKKLIVIILVLMVAALASIGCYYWYENSNYVTTEDAKVTGDLVTVSPQMSGKLLELNVEEGDKVVKNQILGRQGITDLQETNIDQSVFRAPIDGVVIKKQGTVGEFISAGSTVAVLVDPDKLYISANIEETKLTKIKEGQQVDVTIDQFSGKSFSGKVKYVGQASNSAFALLPTSTSSTFTKVIQKVPVKIEFDKKDAPLLPGTNAIVKIHIK
ncbi:multidrug resistance efflux pump [Desulfosporosinus orientis DSM 765]|uniref:Multidrug resistance efflux pump n=1 Tax=Desulfosporosinus orientis (strain ATCC 19365 / DSM 765 / NCIMB 8382 / VKM B-1628 / Singapore I) TaxID=768706 RepID=G7WAE5_DESOD|nr:HlyD family efflux transporter periplasmic adaptor subunit [Desulfosporosinus orientis]AET66494.1 multidrug resistance efflux pump [Desulfosporosinus orientis DSM 765]